MRAIEVFMDRIIDYAGLFPPAALDLGTALSNYQRYQSHPRASFLGRFVMPVEKINEAAIVLGGTPTEPPSRWFFSGLLRLGSLPAAEASAKLEQASSTLRDFQARFPQIEIDSIELDVPKALWDMEHSSAVSDFLRSAGGLLLQPVTAAGQLFIELDWKRNFAPLIATIAGFGPAYGVKLRTGGLTADAVPPTERIVSFLSHAAQHQVAMKATAGLHVPVPNEDPQVGARMHGFLNVFVAAMLAYSGRGDRETIARVIENFGYDDFGFGEDELRCGGVTFSIEEIKHLRSSGVLSFGSCSFLEPIEHLEKHGLI